MHARVCLGGGKKYCGLLIETLQKPVTVQKSSTICCSVIVALNKYYVVSAWAEMVESKSRK